MTDVNMAKATRLRYGKGVLMAPAETRSARMGRTPAPRAGPRLSASARVAVRRLQHVTQLETVDLAAVLASSGVPISAASLERDLADSALPLDAPLDASRAAWYVAAAVALWDGGDDAPLARVLRRAIQARDKRFPSLANFDHWRDDLEQKIASFGPNRPFPMWIREALSSSQYAESDWPTYFIAGETTVVRTVGSKRPPRKQRNFPRKDCMDATSQAPLSAPKDERARALSDSLMNSPQWTVGDSLPTWERDLFAIFMPSLQRRLIRDFLVALQAGAKEMLPAAIRERDSVIREHAAALRSPDASSPEPIMTAVEALPAYRRARFSAAALLRSFDPEAAREQRLSIGERELLEHLIHRVERFGTVLALPPNCRGPLTTLPRDERARLFLAWWP